MEQQLSTRTQSFVKKKYIDPARQRGEKNIQVHVGTLAKELGLISRAPSICSTLNNKRFHRQAGVRLVNKFGGPASGGPSTTWNFVFDLDDDKGTSTPVSAKAANGVGIKNLVGLCANTFRQLGGGEAFIRSLRENDADVWDKYHAQLDGLKEGSSE
jgi:hypothetical protein